MKMEILSTLLTTVKFGAVGVGIVGILAWIGHMKKSVVVITDTFGKEYHRKGTKKNINGSDKIIFSYNSGSKAGVAIEENVTMWKKKKVYHYMDVNGTLLPVKKNIYDTEAKRAELDLATSQEKLYETEALKAAANKVDESFWEKNKALIMAGFMVMAALIFSIVLVQKSLDVQPVPEPQVQMFNSMTEQLKEVSEINQEQAELINKALNKSESKNNKNTDKIPE